MAKKNKKEQQKITEVKTSLDMDVKKLTITALVVLAVLGAFYLLTLVILKDDSAKEDDGDKETEVQYSEIVLGASFSQKEDKYLVLYYECEDEETISSINSIISSYNSKNSDVKLYTVDMNNGINKGHLAESGNSSATKSSEMAVKAPTLVLFTNHSIGEYIEGIERIENYLK